MDIVSRLVYYISVFIALLIVLPIHEFAHAFVAVRCGDNTPKMYGRYTLNPFAHFDTVGLICFVFAGFGWAKPVPINPYNFKKYKKDSFLVSVSGVIANYLTSFLVFPLFILSYMFLPTFGLYTDVLISALYNIYFFGLIFAVFNLLPLYPLDGFRAIDCFSKQRSKFYYILKNYGQYILIFLFFLSVIADYTGFWQIDILGNFLNTIVNYIRIPIEKFWGLIF